MNKGGFSSNCKIVPVEICIWWQDMHYHLANLCNRITTKMFDIFRIITLKQQKFSETDPVLIRQFWKNCSPIQSWPGKIGFSPDPVLIRAHLCKEAVLNTIRFPDRDPTGFCNSEPDWTGFRKHSTGSDMDIQIVLITAAKCLIRCLFLHINRIGSHIGTGLQDLDRTGLLNENLGLD